MRPRHNVTGHYVRTLRIALGESRRVFGARFGVALNTVWYWESDRTRPHWRHAEAMVRLKADLLQHWYATGQGHRAEALLSPLPGEPIPPRPRRPPPSSPPRPKPPTRGSWPRGVPPQLRFARAHFTPRTMRQLRTDYGDSIAQFARRTFVHPQTVMRWESGRSQPSFRALLRLGELILPILAHEKKKPLAS